MTEIASREGSCQKYHYVSYNCSLFLSSVLSVCILGRVNFWKLKKFCCWIETHTFPHLGKYVHFFHWDKHIQSCFRDQRKVLHFYMGWTDMGRLVTESARWTSLTLYRDYKQQKEKEQNIVHNGAYANMAAKYGGQCKRPPPPSDGNSPFLTCILFKGKWTPAPF